MIRLNALSAAAMRSAGAIISGLPARRLLILTYHRVLPQPDPLLPDEVDAATFEWQLELLSRCFRLMTLAEAVRRLRSGTLPPGAAVITFDDGYANNCEVALPLLRKWSAPATFFIATGFLNGGRMFNDTVIETVRSARSDSLDLTAMGLARYPLGTVASRRETIARLLDELKYLPMHERAQQAERLSSAVAQPLPENLMMNDAQVRELCDNGMEIAGHTVNHAILASLTPRDAEHEISAGRERLQEITQAPVVSFAYPNGRPGIDYVKENIASLERLGFSSSVTTAWGSASVRDDPYQLPRLAPWDRTPTRFWLRLMRAYFQSGATLA